MPGLMAAPLIPVSAFCDTDTCFPNNYNGGCNDASYETLSSDIFLKEMTSDPSSGTPLDVIPIPPSFFDTLTSDNCGCGGENLPSDGLGNHRSTLEWTTTSAQEAELSTSLALTKPKTTHNNHQTEVSSIFTPPEIVLCADGLNRSQVAQLRRVPGAVTPVPREGRRRSDASLRSARHWAFPWKTSC